MKHFLLPLIFGFALSSCQQASETSAEAPTPPNIILVLADDLGYGDANCYNPTSQIPTPAMDKMAAEGVMFTDAHTPSSVCTPTRYGVLCGRYAWRSRLKSGVLSGYSPSLIEEGRQTIPSLLKTRGYETAVVGKWHLGLDWPWINGLPENTGGLNNLFPEGAIDYSKPVGRGANDVGFDYSYLVPGSLDMGPYVYVENGKSTMLPDRMVEMEPFPAYIRKGEISADFSHVDALDHLLDKSKEYIVEHAADDNPFFLYFPLTSPHKPALPHPRFVGKSGIGPHGDFIIQTDWTLGEILKTLEETGIREETLVIFTSDNGSYMYKLGPDQTDHTEDPTIQGYRPEHHTANADWRGTKADIFEAGHRVPFLVSWPGRIAQNKRIDNTICLTDIMATLAALTGAKMDTVLSEDSYNFYPLLSGTSEEFLRPPVVHHSINGTFSVRKGNEKLILSDGSGGREKPVSKPFQEPYQFYDLEIDPQESNNLISTEAEAAGEMQSALQGIRGE